jgi:hypothetical protein
MRLQLCTGAASLLVLIGIGTAPQSSAGQLPPLTTDSMIILAQQKKGCVGDQGARYKDFSDCMRRRSTSMRNPSRYCSRICS